MCGLLQGMRGRKIPYGDVHPHDEHHDDHCDHRDVQNRDVQNRDVQNRDVQNREVHLHNTCDVQSVPGMELHGEEQHELLRGEGGGESDEVHGDFHDGKPVDGEVVHSDQRWDDGEDNGDLAHDAKGHDVHGVHEVVHDVHGDRDHESKLHDLVVEEHVQQVSQSVQVCDDLVH